MADQFNNRPDQLHKYLIKFFLGMEKKAFKRINLLSMFFQFGCNVDIKQYMSDILVVSIVGCTIKIAPMYNFSEKYEVFQQFKKCF